MINILIFYVLMYWTSFPPLCSPSTAQLVVVSPRRVVSTVEYTEYKIDLFVYF